MKELFIAPINPASKQFLDWFKKLYSGTTGANSLKLYALNDKYCLFKVIRPGYSPSWSVKSSGTTEYIVAEIHSPLSGIGSYPKPIYKVTGRMLNAHMEHIEKTYQLNIVK